MSRTVLLRSIPVAIIVAVTGALFAQTRQFGLLGFDAYPIIAASRIQSFGDLLGTFSERLMDGRYASDFYRPLTNLTFAWDHALWGLNPFGYQLTNALLLAASAWAVWALLRRLLGSDRWLGANLGLSVFLFSPLLFEVLPAAPRRPELLCCGLMALALVLQLAPRELAAHRPSVWPALATLLAIASKETGYVLPPLVFVAVWLYSSRNGGGERLRHAFRATVPHLAVAGLMFGLRYAVLGGPGGHRAVAGSDVAVGAPVALLGLIGELLRPQPQMHATAAAGWLFVLLALTLLLTLILGWIRNRVPRDSREVGRPLKAALLALVWIGLLATIYAASDSIYPWYLLLPLAGWSLFVGAVAQGLVDHVEHDDVALRSTALVGTVLLVFVVVWQASYTPLIRHYDEWQRATVAATDYLDELERLIDGAAPGTTLESPPLPFWVAAAPDRPTIRGAAIFADYSIQAWVELTRPERRVRVRYAERGLRAPASHELLVVITRRRDDL